MWQALMPGMPQISHQGYMPPPNQPLVPGNVYAGQIPNYPPGGVPPPLLLDQQPPPFMQKSVASSAGIILKVKAYTLYLNLH